MRTKGLNFRHLQEEIYVHAVFASGVVRHSHEDRVCACKISIVEIPVTRVCNDLECEMSLRLIVTIFSQIRWPISFAANNYWKVINATLTAWA